MLYQQPMLPEGTLAGKVSIITGGVSGLVPQEVANPASYRVSDYADYVSGACIVIDGAGSIHKGS
ncbi:NAD(P)-dependent dehydrogenase (short-subunit alcohol dehydrogenase family) [Caldalkalibacillus uzonensis]|uniref:NAD(P)-dependent dehydrogenase (Short-subunit alcohol dehydrogenase family) n=1 Tax=Caldalkalibacillus uzonensis TaxID=353224 RepID=A0ABU0CXF9_9BACI|nr:hypothetical protein [Caldalkalibacillus uzonensis]MDQ0340834.1 NAD(P)-dependent dehydrogenase (short-subunit alcohol dehydrogenase family) [Caldalkalibacillus uzonensis]